MSLDAIPEVMDWREAVGHIRILRRDPSSQLVVAIEGLTHSLSREGWILSDLVDIQGGKAYGKKWKRYPRPIKPDEGQKKRRGNAAGRTPGEVKAILAKFGHAIPA